MSGPAGTWLLQRCSSDRFPFRLVIMDGAGRPVLALRTQDRWPAANRNIFCLRDSSEPNSAEPLEDVERVAILAMQRRGVRLSVVLDRARYKRCDFLFTTREYKTRPGEKYEQIYWQTQTSMAQRRPYVAPPAIGRRGTLNIAVASDERYPWAFPGSVTERRKLPIGDYALLQDGQPVAIVERKTLDNLLGDFRTMPVLNQRMLELASHPHHAMVIEAPYEDFLNPARVHHYSAAFCAAAIADLYVAHPRLRIVFCANRKTANRWTAHFFAAVHASLTSKEGHSVQRHAKGPSPDAPRLPEADDRR